MANLVEIFWSAQGEGPHVGCSTVFVRLGECDLRCSWCDSPHTWRPAAECRIETAPGTGRFETLANPLETARVADALDDLAPPGTRFLSLTGGEPLLQPEAVRQIAALARTRGLRVQLETHGLAVGALEQVVEDVDVVSMDWKLASDVRAADPDALPAATFAARHREFLAIAARAGEVHVKVVLTTRSAPEELDAVCDAVCKIAPDAPLVLQPVTPVGRAERRPDAVTLLAYLMRCQARVREVRLIPQTHVVYGAP